MTGYLVDTNVLSEYAKPEPNPHVMLWFEQADPNELDASVITFGELRIGVASDGLIAATALKHDLTLWMATRPGSRKLDQLRANPTATLHFAEDSKAAYLSLMGTAHIPTDPATIHAKNPYKGPALTHFFPNFPADFVLLGFKPQRLELATQDIPGNPATWQPQGLKLGT